MKGRLSKSLTPLLRTEVYLKGDVRHLEAKISEFFKPYLPDLAHTRVGGVNREAFFVSPELCSGKDLL